MRPESLYRPAPVVVDTVSVKPSNGLVKVSRGYRVIWGDEPLKGACDVELEPDCDAPEKAALYSLSGGDEWKFLSGKHIGKKFTGSLGGSGSIAVFADTQEPDVVPVSPRPGSAITSRRPLLRAGVKDDGSGIKGSDSIIMSIDGITIYGEYDFEADRVSYRLHNPLRRGTHTVKVTVTDRVGNAKTREWKFRIK